MKYYILTNLKISIFFLHIYILPSLSLMHRPYSELVGLSMLVSLDWEKLPILTVTEVLARAPLTASLKLTVNLTDLVMSLAVFW